MKPLGAHLSFVRSFYLALEKIIMFINTNAKWKEIFAVITLVKLANFLSFDQFWEN